MAKDSQPRLRVKALDRPLHIVLIEPEIPQNTGNIGRLAAAVQFPLHLVGKLGFQVDEKAVRRAGLDYWHLVQMYQHPDLAHFQKSHPDARLHFFSSVGKRSYLEAEFRPGDAIVFGKESCGLDQAIIDANQDACFALPTSGEVRSLNLANTVSIVSYEALRQLGGLDGAQLC